MSWVICLVCGLVLVIFVREHFHEALVRPRTLRRVRGRLRLTREERVSAAEARAERALWRADPDYARQVTVTAQGGEYLDKLVVAGRLRAVLAPYAQECQVAGSIRRGVPTPGDVDMVVLLRESPARARADAASALLALADEGTFQRNDPFVWLRVDGVKCDVALTRARDYGAYLLSMTGSREFNRLCEQRARALGYRLDEGHVVTPGGCYSPGRIHTKGSTEKEILVRLGLLEYEDPVRRSYV